jgi:plastocyanin
LPSPRNLRRSAVLVAAAVLSLGTLGGVALSGPAAAKSSPPVKLDGKVNNKGNGTIKNGKVEIEQDDYYFEKTFLKGTAGDVTVKLENEGSTTHSFTIDDQNIDVDVKPGKTKTVTVSLTDGEPVNFYCTFHVGQGMQGALYTAAGSTP